MSIVVSLYNIYVCVYIRLIIICLARHHHLKKLYLHQIFEKQKRLELLLYILTALLISASPCSLSFENRVPSVLCVCVLCACWWFVSLLCSVVVFLCIYYQRPIIIPHYYDLRLDIGQSNWMCVCVSAIRCRGGVIDFSAPLAPAVISIGNIWRQPNESN
jgi:hypothetical protein